MNNFTQDLGVLGWGWPSLGDVRLVTDSEGNVTIFNSLSLQTFLPQPSYLDRTFERQADGTYQGQTGDKGILTQEGNLYQLREKDGTLIGFRADGQLDYVEDANGYRLTAGYTNNRLTSISASNGDNFTLSYNAQGRMSTVTDQTDQTTTYTYDSSGQLLTGITDQKGTTNFTYGHPYDPMALTGVTYADGSKITYDYDEFGRLQQVIYGEGRQALAYTYTYDASGGVTVTDPSGAFTQVLHNDQGQVSQIKDVLNRVMQYGYNAAGQLTGISTPLGFNFTFAYDSDGNLMSQTNPLNQTVQFTYEPNFGRLESVTDARSNEIVYDYDSKGNLTSILYEDGSQQSYSYDTNGLLTQSTNRRGQDITYSYNDQYQITQQLHEDSTSVSYTYDSTTGEIESITNSQGTTEIDYDQANNRLTINYGTGRSLIYTFDALGRRTQLVTQDGLTTNTTNYSYDYFGRLDRLTDGSNNLIVDYNYNPVTGFLERETNGNGTYTTYSYDLAGQLTSLINYTANGSINSRFDYTYDALGRRTGLTTLDGTWTYTYDLAGQLTHAVLTSTNPNIASQDLTYIYDAAGNRIQTIENGVTGNYQTNNLNQYTTAGGATYSYDADGNLISKTEGGRTWSYTYDDQNRLKRVVDPDNNITEYEYTVFGDRSATIYNGQRTKYLVDPFGFGDVLAEYNGSGNLIASYTHGLGLVSRRDANNATAYYDFDAIGSTVGLTGATGTTLNRYSYRPFGEDFYEVETVANPFEYVGQFGVMEEANGLDFMRARYYTSSEGRFLNPDPVGILGGLNLYAYVENNPVSLIDPLGLWGIGIQGGATAAGGFGPAASSVLDFSGQVGLFTGGGESGVGANLGLAGSFTGAIAPGLGQAIVYGGTAGVALGGFITNANTAEDLVRTTTTVTLNTPIGSISLSGGNGIFSLSVAVGPSIGTPFSLIISKPTFEFALPPLPIDRILPPSPPNPPLPPGTIPNYPNDIENEFGRAEQQSSPLVLDLDGDGIELTALESLVIRFDIDGDGFREATGWVQPDDGLLVLDRNGDRFINDNSELFGNQTTSGFVKLRELDSNNDGFIDADDTVFPQLQVWRDLDSDGRSDVNELYTLTELNISRISAVANPTHIINAGNRITETTFYQLTDGTTREIVDVWFSVHQLNSIYDHRSTFNQPVTFTEEILNLPNLHGYGDLPDLQIAMAKDPQLLAQVKTFTEQMEQGNISSAGELIRPLFFRWAGVDAVSPTSRGSYVNAQELGFLEQFMGRPYRQSDDSIPLPRAVPSFHKPTLNSRMP